MFFLGSAVGLIAVSRRLARDPQWRHIATYTLGAGLVALAGFVVLGVFAIPDDAPLHDWAGLAQRVVILVVLFPARIALSLQLLRGGGSNRRPMTGGGSRWPGRRAPV